VPREALMMTDQPWTKGSKDSRFLESRIFGKFDSDGRLRPPM
jgi:hypothetical protein